MPESKDQVRGLQAAIVPVTPLQQNCTLLWDAQSRRGAVFDPGGDVPRILQAIEHSKVKIERVYLTHGHIDHASGATELAERLGIEIVGPHRADQFLLDSLEVHAPSYGIANARNVTPSRWLEDGEQIEFEGHKFDVLHCPGHTPGSVVYACPEERLALVGDVLFQGSVGRTDFPYGDHDTLMRAITDKLLPLGDDMTFVPGHGQASTIGHERRTNPFIREFV